MFRQSMTSLFRNLIVRRACSSNLINIAFVNIDTHVVCFGGYNNNTWDNEYRFTAINPITDYDIWGKPGGAFRLGVLGVLMGRSGYLRHKKSTILSLTRKITPTWLLSALQGLPHISDLELTDYLVSTTYNEKCELTTTAKKKKLVFEAYPGLVLCFLPKISTFLPPGHILSINPYTSSGFLLVSLTSETITSVSSPRFTHEGNLKAPFSSVTVLTPTSICSFVWFSQCPVRPVRMTRWS